MSKKGWNQCGITLIRTDEQVDDGWTEWRRRCTGGWTTPTTPVGGNCGALHRRPSAIRAGAWPLSSGGRWTTTPATPPLAPPTSMGVARSPMRACPNPTRCYPATCVRTGPATASKFKWPQQTVNYPLIIIDQLKLVKNPLKNGFN